MSDNRACEFWRRMVALTDASGCESIRAIRIALFVYLQRSHNDPVVRQAHRSLRSAWRFLPGRKKPLPSAERNRLLFCFAHGTPANMRNLTPVAREAMRRGLLGGIVAADGISAELAEFEGRVPVVTQDMLVSQLTRRHQIAAEAWAAFREISQAFSGYDRRLTARLNRNAGTILNELILSFRMSHAFPILLEAWSPSCVVSTSDLWPFEYQLASQASAIGIPSVVIQHGVVDNSWWPFQADLFVAWGDYFKDQMQALGAPETRLAVGGMPAADQVFASRQPRRGGAGRGIVDRPVCLILSHSLGRVVEPEVFARFKEMLSESIRSMPGVSWKLRLHPSEDDAFYRELGDDIFQRLEILPHSVSLVEAVQSADVATTVFSASGLDAMMLDCPVIITATSPRVKELAPWPELGGGVYAHNAGEFRQHLEAMCSPQLREARLDGQRRFLDHSFANAGRASEAIVDILNNKPVLDRARQFFAGGTAA